MSDPQVRTVRRRFVVLTALRWLRVGPIVAVLVVLLQGHGVTLAQIGAAFAAYGVATFLLELPTGGLADTLGTRPVMLLAIGVDVVATVPLLVGATAWVLMAAAPLGLAPLQAPVVVSLVAHAAFAVAVVRLVTPRPRDHQDEVGLRALLRQELRRVPKVVAETVRIVRRSPDLARLLGVVVAAAIPLVVTEVLWQPAVADHASGSSVRTDLLGLLAAGIFAAAAAGSWLAPRIGGWFGHRLGRAVPAGRRHVTCHVVEHRGRRRCRRGRGRGASSRTPGRLSRPRRRPRAPRHGGHARRERPGVRAHGALLATSVSPRQSPRHSASNSGSSPRPSSTSSGWASSGRSCSCPHGPRRSQQVRMPNAMAGRMSLSTRSPT